MYSRTLWQLGLIALLVAFPRSDAGAESAAGSVAMADAPDAETIYERACEAWNGAYPSDLEYTVTVRVLLDGAWRSAHYAGEYQIDRDALHVNPFSAEETSHPVAPTGINVDFAITVGMYGNSETIFRRRWSRDPPPTDFLGVPVLSPVYSFGIAKPHRLAPPPPYSGQTGNLATIGSVSTKQRDYDVTFVGAELCGAEPSYHLALRPLRDPKVYRLRDMWVDAASYDTLKVVTDGNFTSGPSLRERWTTTFRRVDGAQYVDVETAGGPLDYGPGRLYEQASISFESPRPRVRGVSTTLSFMSLRHDDELKEPSP